MTHKRPIALDPSTFMVPAIMNNMKDMIMKATESPIHSASRSFAWVAVRKPSLLR